MSAKTSPAYLQNADGRFAGSRPGAQPAAIGADRAAVLTDDPSNESDDDMETVMNDYIETLWPRLDRGVAPGDLRAAFSNTVDSWEPPPAHGSQPEFALAADAASEEGDDIDNIESITNDLIADTWPRLDRGVNIDDLQVAFVAAMESWEPADRPAVCASCGAMIEPGDDCDCGINGRCRHCGGNAASGDAHGGFCPGCADLVSAHEDGEHVRTANPGCPTCVSGMRFD